MLKKLLDAFGEDMFELDKGFMMFMEKTTTVDLSNNDHMMFLKVMDILRILYATGALDDVVYEVGNALLMKLYGIKMTATSKEEINNAFEDSIKPLN